VNKWWSENAKRDGGEKIANFNTGVWMDRIGAIEEVGGKYGGPGFDINGDPIYGLREHLDAAVDQGADLFHFVVYDLPGRDCSAESSNGELEANQEGMDAYKHEYIDRIANIVGDSKYSGIRIVAIIEIDSLPNLVTNLDLPECEEVGPKSEFGYGEGVRYALTKLSAIKNVYNYVDAAHSGWLGWDSQFQSGTEFLAAVIKGGSYKIFTDDGQGTVSQDGTGTIAGPTPAPGWKAINGFITNTANYTPLEEPYIDPKKDMGGKPMRSATFYDWNPRIAELQYGADWLAAMKKLGAPSTIGMLHDTGRNGWGGSSRPTKTASGSEIDTVVNASRIDRRPHRGSWCNQEGSGVGERPKANPKTGVHAYVWTKPQGESDGVSDPNFEVDPADPNKKHDEMCDPEGSNHYAEDAESTAGQGVGTGAMPDAPHAGRWYSYGFKKMLENAYPKL
jgi:cellulose 1,4-beta-cellobiosidase